ncbi:MAG: hypothetical protein NT001_05840 [Candidatus Woesearchaeota archaeon]|nr:hypothetical protein [Candidatus Woesearchaeota archaeon]
MGENPQLNLFEEERFCENEQGEIKKIKIVRDPFKMSLYGLARSLLYLKHNNGSQESERINVYSDIFMSKVYPIIKEELSRRRVLDRKPTKEERAQFKREAELFSTIFRNNLIGIIRGCRDDKKSQRKYFRTSPSIDSYISRIKLSEDQKSLNRAIFNSRIQNTVSHLADSPGFSAIMYDYSFVKNVCSDPGRFSELEVLCKAPLHWFMTQERIRYIDEESQYQEGLLAIWACAQKYKGRNFARFSTMARKALHNKFINLLVYYDADARRIMRKTLPAGNPSDPKDSYLARRIDDFVTNRWVENELAQMNDPDYEYEDYNPFVIPNPIDRDYLTTDYEVMKMGWEERLELTDTTRWEEVSINNRFDCTLITSKNFPHLNEFDIETADKGHLMTETFLYHRDRILQLEEEGIYFELSEQARDKLKRVKETGIDLDKEIPF